MSRRDQNTSELVAELRQLKFQQYEIAEELINRLSKETIQDMKDGLVRLNFAAPPGFMRALRNR